MRMFIAVNDTGPAESHAGWNSSDYNATSTIQKLPGLHFRSPTRTWPTWLYTLPGPAEIKRLFDFGKAGRQACLRPPGFERGHEFYGPSTATAPRRYTGPRFARGGNCGNYVSLNEAQSGKGLLYSFHFPAEDATVMTGRPLGALVFSEAVVFLAQWNRSPDQPFNGHRIPKFGTVPKPTGEQRQRGSGILVCQRRDGYVYTRPRPRTKSFETVLS